MLLSLLWRFSISTSQCRVAVALVEGADDLAAETPLSTAAMSGTSAVREEAMTPSSMM